MDLYPTGKLKSPTITVVMPAYNSEEWLLEAVCSVLDQEFFELELLVVDDGSILPVKEVLDGIQDSRLQILRHPINRGIAAALNTGIAHARGRYIARLDPDDIMLNGRLTKQLLYLERQSNVAVVGMARIVKAHGGVRLHVPEFVGDDVSEGLFVGNPLAHPTVMIRKKALDCLNGPYSTRFRAAEDYHLWVLLARNWAIANLAEPGIVYREHVGQVGSKRRVRQVLESMQVRMLALFLLRKNLTQRLGLRALITTGYELRVLIRSPFKPHSQEPMSCS